MTLHATYRPVRPQRPHHAHKRATMRPRAGEKGCNQRLSLAAKKPQPRLHCSQQFSTVALTTSTATIAERYAYTAYGAPTVCNASGTDIGSSTKDNRITYTGREWDDELMLYHFRARLYDAGVGRFLGRDPIGYEEGASLVGIYISLTLVDPTGEAGIWEPRDPRKGGPNPPVLLPRRPSNPAPVECPTETYLWARIAAIKLHFLGAAVDAGLPEHYSSMPFQHCVWNCRTTLTQGEEAAAIWSMKKELADVAICLLANSLPNRCLARYSSALMKEFVGTCCSAWQTSDFRDNATGRICGKITTWRWPFRKGVCGIENLSCEDCCRSKGSNETTPDGPGTTRPCGPYMPARWNWLHGSRSPQDW